MSRQEAARHPVFTARSLFAAHRQTKRKAMRPFYAPDSINPINKKGKSIRNYKVSVRRSFKDGVYLQDRLCSEVTSSPRAEFIRFIWNCFWETDCVRPNNRSAGMQPTARKCVRLFFKLSKAENSSGPARPMGLNAVTCRGSRGPLPNTASLKNRHERNWKTGGPNWSRSRLSWTQTKQTLLKAYLVCDSKNQTGRISRAAGRR